MALPRIPLARRQGPARLQIESRRIGHLLPGIHRVEPRLPRFPDEQGPQLRHVSPALRWQPRIAETVRVALHRRQPLRHRARHQRQHLVKPIGMSARLSLLRRPVEPRQMREQQPRIEPTPHRHLLAMVKDSLLHPIERPRRQHFLDMPPRQHQCRIPALRKESVPPPQHVGRLPRQPHRRTRRPHVPLVGQPVQKPNPPLGGPRIVR
ncbi:hypothetical protein EDF56_103237 [Novosphingobium sp. PhB165]|uniref:hypothetical protein n=1 Tax=Novosphingobium sp. PhB165 TaxID=2485105 RepID=UPI0010EEE5A7|nr:hypothetical protein [Novosphingobium sp. PhB165]TCM19594.1 hypothetical protein EDF56_103237 [Novosphingobium sp. PhB165]